MSIFDEIEPQTSAASTAHPGGYALVQGIKVFLAPAPLVGPPAAGIVFRVGTADESLRNHGITHLVEHLALHHLGVSDYHYNGMTTPALTHFYTQGAEADLVAFLNSVCAALASLPLERLELEKGILRTEAKNHAYDELALWRHGARDFGLAGYPEWAVEKLEATEVQAWSHQWFTRANAAVWISLDHLPEGLILDLPDGALVKPPAPSSALPVTPAYFNSRNPVLTFSTTVPRSTVNVVLSLLVERRLFQELRQEGGYSYSLTSTYSVRTRDTAMIVATADSLPDQASAAWGAFVDVLARLRFGRLDEAELQIARAKYLEQIVVPDAETRRLPSRATDALLGQSAPEMEQLQREAAAVTVEDIARAAQIAWDAGLFMLPPGLTGSWAGIVQAPTYSESTVEGTSYRSLENDSHLVIGSHGVSLVQPEGASTVLFRDLEVTLAWPDGARQLIGADGFRVHIEPTLFAVPQKALAGLDLAIPSATVLARPERSSEEIPTPEPRAVPAAAAGAVSAVSAQPKRTFGRFARILGRSVVFGVHFCTVALGILFVSIIVDSLVPVDELASLGVTAIVVLPILWRFKRLPSTKWVLAA